MLKASVAVALVVTLGAVAGVPGVAVAQGPPSERDLRLERKQRRVIVNPRPLPETTVQDTERFADDVSRQAREDSIVRDGSTRAMRRPNLDRDVTGGIQSRSLNNAIRR